MLQAQREADRVRSKLKRIGFDRTGVPVVCFATDIVSTIISRAIYFVQGGVLSALLWVFGVA